LFFSKNNCIPEPDISTAAGFESIYRACIGKLCRIAYNYSGDKAVAEGIVQEVFSSVWERRKTLQLTGPVENYLVRAVKLAVLDTLRRQASRRKHIERSLENRSESLPLTEQQVYANDLIHTIDKLVGKLSPQCKQVYELSRGKGLTNREIADGLQIAEKTVEAHLTKALKFLKINLIDYQY